MENNNQIYTEEEKKILDKSLERREIMLQELFKDGVPSPKAMRLANEILNAQDASINATVSNRLKQKEVSNLDAVKDLTVSILMGINTNGNISSNIKREFKSGIEFNEVPGLKDITPGDISAEVLNNGGD